MTEETLSSELLNTGSRSMSHCSINQFRIQPLPGNSCILHGLVTGTIFVKDLTHAAQTSTMQDVCVCEGTGSG